VDKAGERGNIEVDLDDAVRLAVIEGKRRRRRALGGNGNGAAVREGVVADGNPVRV
jgi:hypothetical protein